MKMSKRKKKKYYQQKVEKYLYSYPALKINIQLKKEDILNLEREQLETCPAVHMVNTNDYRPSHLTVEDKRKLLADNIRVSICYDEILLNRIERALNYIRHERYYKIIQLRYFDNMNMQEVASEIPCDIKTAYSNKDKLLDKLMIIFFGAEALELD